MLAFLDGLKGKHVSGLGN